MRIKVVKVTFLIAFVNFIAWYYSWRFISGKSHISDVTPNRPTLKPVKLGNKHISKLVTVILRSFDLQENDVTLTVESILHVFPNIQILILSNGFPYPPLDLQFTNYTFRNVKLINLSLNLNIPVKNRYPLLHLKTKYALFVPDSVRITSRQIVQTMVGEITKNPEFIFAVSCVKSVQCLKLDVSFKEWTLKYSELQDVPCDAIRGNHAFILQTHLLKECADPFFLPFPESLYIQTALRGIKVKLLKDYTIHSGKPLHHSHHAQWRLNQLEERQRKQMYDTFAIKKVIRGDLGTTEWFGCTRETPRCFGTVIDSMPSYLYEGHWTPPCCLANLRAVARHVFERLDSAGARYWLTGGSLLGAMRRSDIIPWDHDVDVGVYRDDLDRCEWLRKAKVKPVVDAKGFVWEKATEGDFFRVLYSKANRVHVNIFPFFVRNGTMTKDSWFTSHKNVEFPEHFLHPMSSIEFINRLVPSPNNIRDFLEIKYGKGVIENPQYPDPKKLKFS